MEQNLNLLIVDDSPDDAELITHELRKEFVLSVTWVDSAEEFRRALAAGTWDIIISDYLMPQFSGLEALQQVHERNLDTPFIMVSGKIGEDAAVEAMRAGAHDYLIKDNLARLIPAIHRELREAASRRERRRAEEQLRQAQKMEAIGQLAGGISHDFNNLLTIINGYSTLLLRDLERSDPLRKEVEHILHAGERAAELTRQLLAFSRRQILEPRVLELNQVVRTLEKMLRRLIGEQIELTTELAATAGCIKADPGQIEQIILNLVVNARDAISGEEGTITLRTACVNIAAGSLRTSAGPPPSEYLLLEVRDTGCGMDDEVKSRLFEPFFTTKEKGKGTGLGLATVYGIVSQSGGQIQVVSQPGAGTSFRIYLPRVQPREELTPEMQPLETPTGTQTVLVVEDEVDVLALVVHLLRSRGYRVIPAAHPQAAVELFLEQPAAIDLLLTDVVMPQISGPKLAAQLRRHRPDLPVLFMSGHAADTLELQAVIDGGHSFVAKPFMNDELMLKVGEILCNSSLAENERRRA
jgi:signal transduction histidine kinase